MPKFKVLITRMIEQSCEVEIEAATAEQAAENADTDPADAKWEDGDYVADARVYGVCDLRGELVLDWS
jgi:hypothetical protein